MRLSLFDRYATQLTLPEQTSLLEIDQAAHTHAVILSQTAGAWGAESGANEQGVCAGYTSVVTRLSRSGERVLTPAELTRCVICFCSSVSVVMVIISWLLSVSRGDGIIQAPHVGATLFCG